MIKIQYSKYEGNSLLSYLPTLAAISETMMNKAIQAESESMGVKPMFNSLRGQI